MLADAGYLAIPVVVLPSGQVLVEPSDASSPRPSGRPLARSLGRCAPRRVHSARPDTCSIRQYEVIVTQTARGRRASRARVSR